ncbi:MAG: substrate-binding domain-containing protein [Saccharofermentanales bacterium]|jgi:phosphate transport system substrate-binding protein|nr:substrate-binding domain-containing protein [Bacillota bacterium]
MKSLKKYLVAILSLIMVISAVAACGGGSETQETETTAEETVTEAEKATDVEKETEADTEADTETDSDADGKMGQINVYTRDAASGTREGFENVVDFKDQLTDNANEVASNGEMATQVGQDAQAIGYVSLTTDFEANNLHPASYEGVEPTVDNVLDGSYLLNRPFCYTTRAAGDYESDELEQLVKAFIVFMTESTEGKEAVLSAGGIVDVEDSTSWDELKVDHPIVDQDNSGLTITTGGSTSVEKTLVAALDAFKPLAGNFETVVNQTGSSDGWARTLGDDKDGPNASEIGFASRNFKDEEDTSDAISSGKYCDDAIVTVVEKTNSVVDFTQQQLFDIFTGAVTNWEDIAK